MIDSREYDIFKHRKMSKKILFAFVGLVGVVGLFVFIFTNPLSKKEAAVKLVSHPNATVFVNGKEAGSTPYENDSLTAELTTFKLVPNNSDQFWQRDLDLTPNAQTIVNWNFDSEDEQQFGSVLYLEKISSPNQADMLVTCQPQSCSVKIDGQLQGQAPINQEGIGAGEHTITVSQPGYQTQEVTARTVNNYRLVVEMELAQKETDESQQPTPTSGPDLPSPDLPKVRILETPTGWLRVREGPSTGNPEVAKVDPGDEFVLLDEQGDWYKIEYEEDEEGWISSTYAEKLDSQTSDSTESE
jgi:hypothetical protein